MPVQTFGMRNFNSTQNEFSTCCQGMNVVPNPYVNHAANYRMRPPSAPRVLSPSQIVAAVVSTAVEPGHPAGGKRRAQIGGVSAALLYHPDTCTTARSYLIVNRF